MNKVFPTITPLISALPFQKNNYEFLTVLGIGGSSVVFKVHSNKYRSTFFAAKVIPKSFGSVLLDLAALKSLIHSYIISIYDFFEDEQNFYLITEFCSNGSLSNLIKSGQICSKGDMIFYMKKLANAIYFCHSKGIAHRDIKPSNILLDSYGRPKLIDFGICEMLYADDILADDENDDTGYFEARRKGQVKLIKKFYGSAPYLSPEIILKEPYDPFMADVWSLGVTFFEIVTGSLPWNPESGKMMSDAICQSNIIFPQSTHPHFQQLIKAMTQVDPKKRPTMKLIFECSLFKSEVPSSLKLFKNQSNLFDIGNQSCLCNNNNVQNDSSSKKLKKAPNCVTFSNYESFVNNKNCNCSLKKATSSLVYSSPVKKANEVNITRPRKNSCIVSPNNIMLKAYSSANSFRIQHQNRKTFLSDE